MGDVATKPNNPQIAAGAQLTTANSAAASPAPGSPLPAPAATPVVFAIQQVVAIAITCPGALNSATLSNGLRVSYQPGPFKLALMLLGQAGAFFTLNFDDAAIARQFAAALGLAASSITHFLTRTPRRPAPLPPVSVPARGSLSNSARPPAPAGSRPLQPAVGGSAAGAATGSSAPAAAPGGAS